MRSFRQFSFAALLIAFVSCSFIFVSCKNKCGSTTCQNGGTCDNNACICPAGYSGNSCQTGWSDPAIGTYTCSRSNCSPTVTGVNTWQSAITKSSTDGGFTINISNFNNSNTTVIATIDSAIANRSQRISVSATNGIGVNASGYLSITNSVTTISLHYTTYSGTGVIGSECDMVLRKL